MFSQHTTSAGRPSERLNRRHCEKGGKHMASTLPLSSSVTVLMIDDNPEDLESWSKRLGESSSQYSILKAQTVRAALDLCQYQKVDCVVLDLDMEHSSGF